MTPPRRGSAGRAAVVLAVAVRAVLAGALVAAGGCAGAAPERVREGERQLAAGDHEGARRSFQSVLDDPKATPLDRRRAEVGEARAFLARGDLVGARSRLRRLDDALSDKWYLLGVIAVRERDPAEATRCLRIALDRAHGPEAATLLAEVLAGEARDPAAFVEAAAVVERAGDAARGAALREAAAVWREATGDPTPLLRRLAAVKDRLGPLAAARVLEARLLERQGDPAAAKAWDLSTLTPPPSAAFQAWAAEVRARLALERGDASALDAALAQADPATAAAVRSRIATARARRGDQAGALALWRQVAGAGGPASPAWAEVAWLEEALGLPGAPEAWVKAEAALTGAPATGAWALARARIALRRAAQGDLVGAAALGAASDADLPPGVRLGLRRLAAARAALDAAAVARVAGDDPTLEALRRALRALDPGGPAEQRLAGAATAPAAPPATQRLVDVARARRALAQGDLAAAGALLGAGADLADAEAQRDLERAVGVGLAAGRLADVARLLEAHAAALAPATRARLRASAAAAALPDALLPAPRGPAALGDGPAWGAVAWPATGQRVDRAEVAGREVRPLADGPGPALDPAARVTPDPAIDSDAWRRLDAAARREVDPPVGVEVLR